MQPTENNSPELSLPKPVESEGSTGVLSPDKEELRAPIEESASKETVLNNLNAKVSALNNSVNLTNTAQSSLNVTDDNQTTLPANSNPLVANDDDLIEKEWVEKAKQIVNKTKEDPYVQSKELSYMKSDYMKKRYNKDIKVSN